ncbi:MAG: carboxypeptidase regulatory-like domain-containing protein, partial [Acidobacteriota bacterium]
MKYFQILFAFTVVVVFASSNAHACTCAGNHPVCQDYWEASAVFVGTVIDSRSVTIKEGEYPHEMRLVRLSLDEAFRGVEGAEVEVLTGFGGGDCGFGFRQTEQYLVYAYQSEGKLYTSICSRTKSISEADKDLAYIRGLAKAKAGATISGDVVKQTRDANGTLVTQTLNGLAVTIDGDQKLQLMTDANGRYHVEDLKPGEYLVKLSFPDGLFTPEAERKVNVADRGCAEVNFWLETNGRLSGRVLNPQGLPVMRAEILIHERDKPRYQGHGDSAYSDEEGRYSFKRTPPGRYVLLIRFDGLTSQTRPFPVTYYPGVSDISQAKVVTISEGQLIQNFDLQMPPLPAEYEVQGSVMWSDGKPAPDARVG